MADRLSRYPQGPDGSSLNTIAMLPLNSDETFTTRISEFPKNPDNSPMPVVGVVFIDPNGNFGLTPYVITYKAEGTGTQPVPLFNILASRIYLDTYLTAAQRTAVALQQAPDVTAALQAATNDAAGREVLLPFSGGSATVTSPISRTPSVASLGNQLAPGFKLVGPSKDLFKLYSEVAGVMFNLNTLNNSIFQTNILFAGMTLNGQSADAVAGDAIYIQRGYDILLSDVRIEYFRARGLHVQVSVNDAGGSNNLLIEMCRFFGNQKWAIDIDPFSTANDMSYIEIRNTILSSNGTAPGINIASISKAASGRIVTSAPHGRTTGDKIYIFVLGASPGFGGMIELHSKLATVTVVDATTLDININTAGYTTYTGGGYIIPRSLISGTIKGRWQGAKLETGAVVESQGPGLYIPDDGPAPYLTSLKNWTFENTRDAPAVVCQGANGLSIEGCDLRASGSVYRTPGHVLLDASVSGINNITIRNNDVIALTGTGLTPFTCYDAIGDTTNLIRVEIGGTYQQSFGEAGQTLIGAAIYGASQLDISDSAKPLYRTAAHKTQNYTTASPTYTHDMRNGESAAISLGAGVSGTLTVASPNVGVLTGAALSGQKLNIIISNASGGTINLTWGFATKSAPTTIANGATIAGQWRYDSALGWCQSGAWI